MRIPVWKKVTMATTRRQRIKIFLLLLIGFGLLLTGISAYKWNWWRQLLDGAVVAIPTIAGFVAWVMPVKQTTSFHRVWLFIGGITFSFLVGLQQWETGVSHAREMAKLATKDDIAKLPTVNQIGLEFQRLTAQQTTPNVLKFKKSPTNLLPSDVHERGKINEVPGDAPSEQIAKGIDDIKRLLGSQQWGLSADQLVTLSRRMAPFASLINEWIDSSRGDLITSVLGNSDSYKFATGLIATLRSAGWNLPGNGMSVALFSGNPQGVIFVLHSRDDANLPVLNQFAATLKEAGVAYHGELRDDVPAGQFRIVIGSKPD
jgi:hypothetical protein